MKHLKGLQYSTLNDDFKLIKEIPKKTLFIKRSVEADNILQKIMAQQKKRKKVKHIPRKFYEYIINVSDKDLMKISGKIESYPLDEEPIFWVLQDDELYDTDWSLRI